MKFCLFLCVTAFVALVAGAPFSDNDNANTTSTTSMHPQDTTIVPHDAGVADGKVFDTTLAIPPVSSPVPPFNICGLCKFLPSKFEDMCLQHCNPSNPTISTYTTWDIESLCEWRCRYFKCPIISSCVNTCMKCYLPPRLNKRKDSPDRYYCLCIDYYGPDEPGNHPLLMVDQNSTFAHRGSDDVDKKLIIRPPPSDPADGVKLLIGDIQELGRMHQTLANITLYNPYGFASDSSEPEPNLAEIDEYLQEWVGLYTKRVTRDSDERHEQALVHRVVRQPQPHGQFWVWRLKMIAQEAVGKDTKKVVARFPEVQRHVVQNVIDMAWWAAFVGSDSAANASAVA